MKIVKICLLFIVLFSLGNCRKKDESPDNVVFPNDYLSSKNYDKLVIQIQSVEGYELTDQTVENLVSFLNKRLNKPMGIEIKRNSIASTGKSTLTINDIKSIEILNRTEYSSGRTLAAYFFVADGDFSENSGDSKVLGVAYLSSSMALFGKTIKGFSGGLGEPSRTTLETTVINHEFGHILGLVNNGTSMVAGHQDESNGKHCSNSDCLMYFNVETSNVIGNLSGNNIPELDQDCINDLKANGGK